MIVLTVRELSRQFDREPVFSGVTFDVRTGEKIGLVGPNGTGKSTLLKILAGVDEADVGSVERSARTTVAMLEQQKEFSPECTLIEEVRKGLAELYALQRTAVELGEKMSGAKGEELQRLQRRLDEVQKELEYHDAYHLEHRVDQVMSGLGFNKEDYGRPIVSFSGGQQNRAVLARLLLSDPEIMLLDEPTNHLDIPTTEWLEEYLAKSPRAAIIVSHDRYFLDKVTERTFELFGGGFSDYPGGFSQYWKLRGERRKLMERTVEKQQEYIAKTEDFIRRNSYGQKSVQAQDRVKKLERLERVEMTSDFEELSIWFGEPTRTGDWVIEAKGLSKSYDRPLFQDVTVQILRGERVGILGPNGSGKTTLVRTLLGEIPADRGSVRLGTNVKIGYFDQQLESVDVELSAVEAIRPAEFPEVTPGHLRWLLARFGIKGELALQRVGAMSGGERSKVALARLAAARVNVLMLDEPTNHLDLWSCSSLEEALKRFEGTLIFVSHDRYFLDQVATRVIVLGEERWWEYAGNYSAWVEFMEGQKESEREAVRGGMRERGSVGSAGVKSEEKGAKRKRKFAYRKVEDLEMDIEATEGKIERLEGEMADPEICRDGGRLKETVREHEEMKRRLKELYAHWEEAVELN